MPPWVAKEKMGTLLLASEMPVSIPRSHGRTVGAGHAKHVPLIVISINNLYSFSKASDVFEASSCRLDQFDHKHTFDNL